MATNKIESWKLLSKKNFICNGIGEWVHVVLKHKDNLSFWSADRPSVRLLIDEGRRDAFNGQCHVSSKLLFLCLFPSWLPVATENFLIDIYFGLVSS